MSLSVQTFHVIYLLSQGSGTIADEAAEEVIQRYGFTLAENVVENRAVAEDCEGLSGLAICRGEISDILAVKCWPEFPLSRSRVCLALSLLNDNGIITACEGDAYGAVTMLIQDLLAKGPSSSTISFKLMRTTTTCCSGTAVPQLLASRHRRQISWSAPW